MNIPNITEARAIKLFTKEFGNDIMSRYKKFQEEVKELDEVYHEYFDAHDKSPEVYKHLLDEFSDVQGTFTHLASLVGLYQQEMLHNCIDKVTTRKTNPNYKRFITNIFDNGVKMSIIPVPEFDYPKGYPKAIKKDNYWIKPDPMFYYDEQHIQDAWKNHFDGYPIKMVRCNSEGIITYNENDD